jgi:hypothetical protein
MQSIVILILINSYGLTVGGWYHWGGKSILQALMAWLFRNSPKVFIKKLKHVKRYNHRLNITHHAAKY